MPSKAKAVKFPEYQGSTDLDKSTYDSLLAVWRDVRQTLTLDEQSTFCELVTLSGRPRSSSRCGPHPINRRACRAGQPNRAYYYVLKAMFGPDACMKQSWWRAFRMAHPELAEIDEAPSSDSGSDSDKDESEVDETDMGESQLEITLQETTLDEITVLETTLQEEAKPEESQDDFIQNAIRRDTSDQETPLPVEDGLEEGQIDETLPDRTTYAEDLQIVLQPHEHPQGLNEADENAILSIMSTTPDNRGETAPNPTRAPTVSDKRPASETLSSALHKRRRDSHSGPAPPQRYFRSAPGLFIDRPRPPPESPIGQLEAQIRKLERDKKELEEQLQKKDAELARERQRRREAEDGEHRAKLKVQSVREANAEYGRMLRQLK